MLMIKGDGFTIRRSVCKESEILNQMALLLLNYNIPGYTVTRRGEDIIINVHNETKESEEI